MTELIERPGHLARRFQQIAVAVFHREVAAAGSDLTPVQFAALEKIRDNPGLDQATIAGLIAYDRATITGVLDRLVARDLVRRATAERDRRQKLLWITEAGQDLIARISPAVETAQTIMLRGLTEAEAQEFMRLLQKTVEAGNDLSRAPLR
ncbi:MarR family winged helix-turn-helix transcriptional regulator [Aurantimonas sp. VKM B-3413]|uniref:MarR family winged helix-turn-helix transcriptional regulator n=1 Tax=Aurantimonas sp. VKM B-3413 TaxID=2779401 RepID=UPI001E63DC85|nr:MarR family transcriptional regulator [Aurantimonas sp. VKM B-3413]MCB8837483.1 MarR family transcriptional regulator [Aurantimonas sp. VKM B-3413]